MTERGMSHHEWKARVHGERWQLLHHVVSISRVPMTILSFVWVGLLVFALVSGLSPVLQALSNAIWVIFVLDFLVEVSIAPHKLTYLRQHWLTALSLLLPAFSTLRVLQAFRLMRAAAAAQSFSLLRIITAVNRGMAATRHVLGRHKVGYVVGLTILVTLAGAAGMYSFESPRALHAAGYNPAAQSGGLPSYGEALWWTAMVMTTMGSSYWPVTLGGQILCFLLAVYAFAVFGYITATIASIFIQGTGSNNQENDQEASAPNTAELQAELAAMRQQLATLVAYFEQGEPVNRLVREQRAAAQSVTTSVPAHSPGPGDASLS